MKKALVYLGLFVNVVLGQQLVAQPYAISYQGAPLQQYQCGKGTVEVGGDWLYWEVDEDKLEFGANVAAVPVITPGGIVTDINSTTIKPKFKYTNGFRVGIDYQTADRNWKFAAVFSNLPARARVSVDNDPLLISTNFISILSSNFPLLTVITAAGVSFSSADSQWKSNINYLDLDLSREICFGSRFQIAPHVGLRGLWIDQKYNITGSGPDAAFTSSLKQNLSGYGVEGGLLGSVRIGGGFSVLGHVGASLLYSRMKNSGSADISTGGALTLILNYTDPSRRATPTIDSYIGLQYRSECSKFPICIRAGWEQHIVFEVNQFSLSGGGNLTTQGLTLGGSIGF